MAKWDAEKVTRPKLYVEIASRIERMMVTGQLQPGEYLPSERELMDLFGVGRSSVREALMSLSSMGLIELSSGEKARVRSPSFDPLLNRMGGVARYYLSRPDGAVRLQEARKAFEAGIVRQAARAVTKDQLRGLEAALQANLRCSAEDYETAERTDFAFHYEIAAIPANPIYTGLLDAVAGWLLEQRTTSMRVPQAVEAARLAHTRIFQAIAARDPEGAAQAMEDHLDEVALYHRQALFLGKGAEAPPRPTSRRRRLALP